MKNYQITTLFKLLSFCLFIFLMSCGNADNNTAISQEDKEDSTTTNQEREEPSQEVASIQDEKLLGKWSYADKMAGSFMGDMVISTNEIEFARMGKFPIVVADEAQSIYKIDPSLYKGQAAGVQFYKIGTPKSVDLSDSGFDDVDYEITVSIYTSLENAKNGKSEVDGVFWKYGLADAINDFSFGDAGYLKVIAKDGTKAGIGVGESIAELEKAGVLKKDKLETGEGTFDVLNIVDKNHGKLGYVMENEEKKGTISAIFITSDKVEYTGLRIGSTWADVLKTAPDAVAHGSEIEGRVSVKVGNHYLRLDHGEWSYNFDQSNIKPDTKVIEFYINQGM